MQLGPYLLGPNDTPENGIYVGDSRILAKAIPDESVDLVLTDPPFGIDFDYNGIYDDDPKQYPNLFQWLVKESNRITRPGGLVFIFVAQPRLTECLLMAPEEVRIFCACKNFVQMRRVAVQFAYDPVLFWQRPGEALRSYKGRDWHLANTAATRNRGLNEAGWHPCPRPLDTVTYMIENFSPNAGTVADFFMGSGTTALACCLTGRHWWGAEIISDYANLARKRIRHIQPLLPLTIPEQQEMTLT